jgi:hypothetical protein
MKLFSEKVNHTFTNSSFNILQVENFSEIFFDVYEIELNKAKYPVEKVDDYNGHPVVSVPVVIGEQEYQYPFVLMKGAFEVLFNENNKFENVVYDNVEPVEVISESFIDVVELPTSFEQETNYDNLVREDSKKKILEEIQVAKQNAAKQIDKLKKSAIADASFDIKIKKKEFDKTLQEAKDQLVNEFVSISNKIKSELLDANNSRYSEIKDSVSGKIGLLAEKLQENIADDFESASKIFDDSIKSLVMELHTTSVLPKLKDELSEIAKDVVQKVATIEDSLNSKLSKKADISLLEGVSNEINAITVANTELNNAINKGVNKALSRVGNVNNRIDEVAATLVEDVDNKIQNATDNINKYYSDKLAYLEDQAFEINEKTRKYFIELIQESKDNLINEIRNIKKESPIEYVIESNNKRNVKSFDSITSELDKKISDKISDEVIRLRKYIAVYSGGGGTVAQQFADGGVMNGNLTVAGSISASNYLGLVIPNPDLSQYLPISGGTITGDLVVNNTLSAYSLSADRIFTSQLDALSANITVIDIKQYELSGFNVTGDCTIQGSVSSNSAVYGSNLVYLGGNSTGSNVLVGTNDSYNLALETSGVTRMTILSSGNVGIGVSNPGQGKLVIDAPIAGTNRNLVFQQSIAAAGQVNEIVWRSSAGTIFDYSKIKTSYGNSFFNSYFTIQVANSALALQDRFHINVAGNVGIGTTTPNERLTVVGNISSTGTSNTIPNQTAASPDFKLIATQEMAAPFPTFGGPPPYYRIFEDFPTNQTAAGVGTHGWTQSGAAGSNFALASFNTSQPTVLAQGVVTLTTGVNSGAFRSIYLVTGGASSVGNSIHTLFAMPTATDLQVDVGFSGGGSGDVVMYNTLSGGWYASKTGNSGVFSNLLTTSPLSAGNFVSGVRYKVSMNRPSGTTTRVHIAYAPFNSPTWTTIYDDTVTHANHLGGWNQVYPTVIVSNLSPVDRSVMIDYIGVEKLLQR